MTKKTNKQNLYKLLQINGGTFPIGGFSQSWGLETYVMEGIIHDADTFTGFLEAYLISNIGKSEGPIIREAHDLFGSGDAEGLTELECLSNASKTTKESREAGIRMGKAFLRILKEMISEEELKAYFDIFGNKDISYPVIYGIACCIMEIDIEEAVRAHIYSTANTLAQSAVKLIPMGNSAAQKILYDAAEVMEQTVEISMGTAIDDITNFCPGIDIASIKHENLSVRLYMS